MMLGAVPTAPAVPFPLGEVELLGVAPCDGEDCYEVEVRCPGVVVEPATATVKVGAPRESERGTILFMTGGGGGALWETFGPDAARVLGELRAAGFRTVQIAWGRPWLEGAPGQLEGHARLACRPATLARWVYDRFHAPAPAVAASLRAGVVLGPPPALAFCATGNSGGAAQASYMLTHYGLAAILDAVVPTGGPPMGRIDLGCLRDDPANEPLWYSPRAAARIDRGFGFFERGEGPCARSDASFRERFRAASVVSEDATLRFDATRIWFVFGELDASNAVEQGLAFYEALLAHGSPLVERSVVPDTPHATPSTRQGAERIRDILLAECRPR